jgi:apolipoprotein N-acyltransferase
MHRLFAPRIPGFRSTLIFPLAWVGIEFIFHRWITPYGSWASLAYTQTDFSSLLQVASLTGTAGISFLMVWFASIAAVLLRPDDESEHGWMAAAAYMLVLGTVLFFGHYRLSRPPPEQNLFRTAGIVPSVSLMGDLERALAPIRRGEPASAPLLDTIADLAGRLNDDLFERTRREARAGARLVAWSETDGRTLKLDEPRYLERAARLAAEEDVYVVMAYGVWNPGTQPPLENKLAAIAPSSGVVWDYHKAYPIIGAESYFMSAGDGVVRALDTSFGRISAVICHDLDFPALLGQAARQKIGLMIGPAADWRAITPLHANMSILRSIEAGFSLLRPTSDGRSLATDSRGRALAIVDYADDAMVAHLRAAPVWTLYGLVGDLFAWLCLAGFSALAALAVFRPRRKR